MFVGKLELRELKQKRTRKINYRVFFCKKNDVKKLKIGKVVSILRPIPGSGSGVQVKAKKAEPPFSQVGVVFVFTAVLDHGQVVK